MIAFLLVALFATIAVAGALTIADAAVRARSALRHLRGGLARSDAVRVITVTTDRADGARMPALRQAAVTAGRAGRRSAVRTPAPLRAAA